MNTEQPKTTTEAAGGASAVDRRVSGHIHLTEPMEELLQLLVDCNGISEHCGADYVCDAIDNTGEAYQSAALAGWLEIAKRAGLKPMLRLPANGPHEGEPACGRSPRCGG